MSDVSDEIPAEAVPAEPVSQPAAESPGLTPGAALRQERERQGLTVIDAARHLKLAARQIEALENDDAKSLPGQVFVRGFTRSYARLLGLDGDALLKSVEPAPGESAAEVPVQAPAPTIGSPVRSRSDRRRDRKGGFRGWLPVTVALIVVAVAIVYFRGHQTEEAVMPAEVAQPSAPAPETSAVAPPATDVGGVVQPTVAPTAPGPASTTAPAVDGTVPAVVAPAPPADAAAAPATTPSPTAAVGSGGSELRFNFDRDAWVEVKDASGSIVFSQLSPAGSERVVRGQPPFQLVVGNAAGVKVTYNARTVDLAPHTRTDVARITLE
jgi:cytoskeleton protein RodZ